ncbi:Cycloartenol synthase [Morella rubra]|uniref:Cycloartenol synthase n=1 Tax=Morella rubra TaxID=262757 RepID=A0A6A1VER7_9ROSI|nr:Cycloartenol synthase [Morella rubra]
MLCCWAEDPNSEKFKLHLPRIFDYLWIAEDGMKMQGYNGSQLWDTAFAVQAIISTNIDEDVLEDCPGDLNFWYRHISKGAWPFSTADHGWPISDCTADGLKVK